MRQDHQVDAVAGSELREDPAHVRLDGRFADEQRLGDLCVGEPAGDLDEDVALTVGELLRDVVDQGVCGAGVAPSVGVTCSNSIRVIRGESAASPLWIARIATIISCR